MRVFKHVAGACLLLITSMPATAGTFDRTLGGLSDAIENTLNLNPRDVTDLKLGVGPSYNPAFEGSRDYKWHAVPVISLQYRDVLRVNNNDIDFTAFNQVFNFGDGATSKLEMGPSVNLDFGRSESVSRDLRGMGNVGFSLELGGYISYTTEFAKLELDFGHDVVSGHGGGLLDLNVSTTLYRGEDFSFGLNATLTLATSKYLKSYFGITTARSIASGLPVFHPKGGLKDAFFGFQSSYTISSELALLAHVGYERLLGDAAASPLIQRRGDANQMQATAFVVYTF